MPLIPQVPGKRVPRKAGDDNPNAKPDRSRRTTVRLIAIATQLPFVIASGYLVGMFLDNYFETTYLKITLLILAIIGAFAQLLHEVLKDSGDEADKTASNDPQDSKNNPK